MVILSFAVVQDVYLAGDPTHNIVYLAYQYQRGIVKLDLNTNKFSWAVAAADTMGFGDLSPRCGYGGDGQLAAGSPDVMLGTEIRQITVGPNSDLYIADTANNRIRKLDYQSKKIFTVAGNGAGGQYTGDNGPAVGASLWAPSGVAVVQVNDTRATGGSRSVLYISDTGMRLYKYILRLLSFLLAGLLWADIEPFIISWTGNHALRVVLMESRRPKPRDSKNAI